MPNEDDELNEEEEEKKRTTHVCNIIGYDIYSDKRQWIVFHPKGKQKEQERLGYFRSLLEAITDIREEEIKKKTLKSKTLEIVIDKIVEFDREFNKISIPLLIKLEKTLCEK